jgi:non-specific serine/threonine protein kinase
VFVGRNREQQDVASLLQGHRLVTLTGPAGVGKTRLAVEVARSAVGRFSAGTWFVDLAPLPTPELVAQTVADVLGVRAEAGMALADTIAAGMANRQALIVLDNCEHVVQACSQLAAAMVTAGPDIRVLATSREPLGIPGEVSFSLSALPVARSDEPWERVAASEAVGLFGARAATARPGFQVTKANAGLIRDICHRLDGIPLALELAAAHVAGLPLRDICLRLDRRYRLLDAGAGAAHGRHLGLGAAVEWSYDLLTEPEQILFERLSVFRGGFTFDAAEAVGTGEGIADQDIAALLSRLVTRSLVQLEEASPAFARYRMLEPLREYAWERLNDRGAASTRTERHARHYFARAVEVEPHLYRADSKPWLDRLRDENENVRAALEWSFSPVGDAQLGAGIAGLVWHMWDLSGARSEGLHWLDAGLQVVDRNHPDERMSLLAAAALLRLGLGDFGAANELATDQLELARTVGDRRWEGDALTRLGTVAWARGDLQTAKPLYREAVEVLAGAGDPWRMAIAQVHLARVHRDSGELNEANQTAEAALSHARQVGEDTVFGFALDVLASIVHQLKRSERASRLVEEALAHYRAVGYREGEASGLQMAGRLLLERGANAAAGQTFRDALDLCQQIGHRAGIATSLEGLGEVMAATGDDLGAATFLGAAAARREAIGVHMPTTERRAWDMDSLRVLTRFGADELERAWRRGADMSLEDLLREAPALVSRERQVFEDGTAETG